jgi:hypothetical protein
MSWRVLLLTDLTKCLYILIGLKRDERRRRNN